jgi:mono/diheme cytochrome c family protein
MSTTSNSRLSRRQQIFSRFLACLVISFSSNYTYAEQTPELSGPVIYQKFCAQCHGVDGAGQPLWYPSLQRIAKKREIGELISAIDQGQFRRAGEADSGDVAGHTIPVMPSWAWLNDEQMTSLIQYLLRNFTEKHGEISVEQVQRLRAAELAD